LKKRGKNIAKGKNHLTANKNKFTSRSKIASKKLRDLQAEFISSTSHQFRTPLATLQSSVELLEYYIKKENLLRQREVLNRIKKSIDNLTETLERITEFYKYNVDGRKVQSVLIDIRKFVNDLIEEVAVSLSNTHILIVNIDEHLKEIFCDEFILKQILLNLINNAIKFSPEGGQIRLEIKQIAKEIEFSIKDEGIGISKHDLKKLFEPFFRGVNTSAIPGVGLGLSIVKNFTDMIKANIKCSSKLNEGSEFKLIIAIR
jgi:signal transduction histidine kinase